MKLILGDITKISTDAIVNAANTELKHGRGVAAAIVAAGGGIIQKESDDLGWCDIGKAAVTGAGNLPAKCVIHVPTIDYKSGKKANLNEIKNGCLAALEIAKNSSCKSIVFPLLGAGVVAPPINCVVRVIKEAAGSNPKIESTLVVHSQYDYNSLKNIFQ
jgi:O-acetyl-ADP-ribose deacetylase (regulator of RNase III)